MENLKRDWELETLQEKYDKLEHTIKEIATH